MTVWLMIAAYIYLQIAGGVAVGVRYMVDENEPVKPAWMHWFAAIFWAILWPAYLPGFIIAAKIKASLP